MPHRYECPSAMCCFPRELAQPLLHFFILCWRKTRHREKADLPMIIQLITGERLTRENREHWSLIQSKIQGTEVSLTLVSNQYVIKAFMLHLETR